MVAGRPDPKTWMDKADDYVNSLSSRPGWADIWRWVRKDRSQPVEFTSKPWEDSVQFQVHNGYAVLRTEVLVDDDIFTEAFLKVEFWPDPERMPEVRSLPVGGNGTNLVRAEN